MQRARRGAITVMKTFTSCFGSEFHARLTTFAPSFSRCATQTARVVIATSASSTQTQRRVAERIALASDGTFAETLVHIVELSLAGCRFIHVDRIPLGAHGIVKSKIAGIAVRTAARLVRSQFVYRGGAAFYESGLQFCNSLSGAPRDVERALNALLAEQMPVPAPSHKPGAPFAFVMCVRAPNGWRAIPTDDAQQPREGFTMTWPEDDAEISAYCKTYDVADAETRKLMRLAFELAIAERMRAV